MALKLTKNEQKKQRDALKTYERFLPTLQLKKKQLQSVIKDYERQAYESNMQFEKLKSDVSSWVEVYAQNKDFKVSKIQEFIIKDKVLSSKCNIAGVMIPVFESLTFKKVEYDLSSYPLWVDRGIETIKEVITQDAKTQVINRALALLEKELRTTSERVNLFEKVMIPRTKANIRKIAVALSDQDTASVVRGKISQKKLDKGAEI